MAMTDMRIDCLVDVPVEQQGGNFADAFRVTTLGNECVLDFMSLSQCRTQAYVVARIRVEKKFLASIRDRLESTLEEIQGQDYCGTLTPRQVEEMWYQIDQLPAGVYPVEGVLPLKWFAVPSEKVN